MYEHVGARTEHKRRRMRRREEEGERGEEKEKRTVQRQNRMARARPPQTGRKAPLPIHSRSPGGMDGKTLVPNASCCPCLVLVAREVKARGKGERQTQGKAKPSHGRLNNLAQKNKHQVESKTHDPGAGASG
jgi:hypothetical protein